MTETLLRLDIGCGPNKRGPEWTGVDAIAFDGVDIVGDAGSPAFWDQFETESVEEAFASHFLEHLTPPQRIALFNGLYRVMKPGAQMGIITPHWASCRAYGDMSHTWPPVSEFFYYYLNAEWRMANAPHLDVKYKPDGFDCNFEAAWGYGMHQQLMTRNTDYQQFALSWYKEAASDLHATITKR